MNKVILIGRTTKDVELRLTAMGKPVASFTIAVDKRNRNDGAEFFDCVAWNATAEAMDKYVHKGSEIAICGRLTNRNFTNRDGVKVYKTEVVADEVKFISTRNRDQAPAGDFSELDTGDNGELPF